MAPEPKLSQRIVRRWKTAGGSSLELVFQDWCADVFNQSVPWIRRDLASVQNPPSVKSPLSIDFKQELAAGEECECYMFVSFEDTRGTDTAKIQLVGNKLVITVSAEPTGLGAKCQESFDVGLAKAPGWIAQALAIQLVKCHQKAWT